MLPVALVVHVLETGFKIKMVYVLTAISLKPTVVDLPPSTFKLALVIVIMPPYVIL